MDRRCFVRCVVLASAGALCKGENAGEVGSPGSGETVAKDEIAEQISWLDGIMTHPENQTLFDDPKLAIIQKELTARWVGENRLALLESLASRFGEQDLMTVIDKIIDANCRRDWKRVGEEGGNSFDRYLKVLWEPLRKTGFEFSYVTQGNKTTFRVTKCPLHDLAKKLGREKWFYHLVCLTDEPSISGFNDKILFSRTGTLMQGYSHCDHCYTDLS